MPEENKDNVFQKMEAENIDSLPPASQAPPVVNTPQGPVSQPLSEPAVSGEMNYEQLSDTPVGENKKYERENLDGQKHQLLKAQLFRANTSEQPTRALSDPTNPDKEYYKCTFILTLASKNKEGVNHREYLSGATQFRKDLLDPQRKDNFNVWYEGAENQVAELFANVAKFKGVEPKDLSLKAFMGFLNSQPHATMTYRDVMYMKTKYHKNFVKEFVQA